MRIFTLFFLLINCILCIGQPIKPPSNQSKISLENANNNRITVLQGGTVINYDLNSKEDIRKLGAYLQKLLSNTSQVSKEIKEGFKTQNNLLVEIAKNTALDGMISLDAYTKGLEKYITENNRLKSEIAQLKSQYQETEFANVLTKAEEKLNLLDNEGYQALLEEFKQKRKKKIFQEKVEIAQAAFLQAQNSYNRFQYAQALTQVEECLEYVIRPDYLLFKGKVLNALFRLQEAIDEYSKIDLNVVNDTIEGSVFFNLGVAYSDKGDYDKAIEYNIRALTIEEKVLGLAHSDVATSYNNLGLAYWKKGDTDKAIEYYSRALTIQEKALGTEHPFVATSYNNLGVAYSDKGDNDKAIEYHTRALAIQEKVLGLNHPSVATSYNNLGSVYSEKGDNNKAIEYYLKALTIREKVLGTEHPDVANSYYNLGVAYSDKGDNDTAVEYYLKALTIREKVLGTEHPDVANSYHNLGSVYLDKGDNDTAVEYYLKALTIREKVLGMTHIDVAASCNNLGTVYYEKGDYDKAIAYYIKTLTITEKLLGLEHPKVAHSYNNLGLTYSKKGDYDKAIEYYDKALDIRIKKLGIEHPDTQSSIFNISVALIANNKAQQGLTHLRQVRSYTTQTGEGKVKSLNSWGVSHFNNGKYNAALNFYTLAINLLKEENIPFTNELWAFAFQNIARAYCYTGDKKKAFTYFDQAIAYGKGMNDAELIKKIQANIEDCKNR